MALMTDLERERRDMALIAEIETSWERLAVDKAKLLASIRTHGLTIGQGQGQSSLQQAMEAVSAEYQRLQILGLPGSVQGLSSYPPVKAYTTRMLQTYMATGADIIHKTEEWKQQYFEYLRTVSPANMKQWMVSQRFKKHQARVSKNEQVIRELKQWHQQQPQLQHLEQLKGWQAIDIWLQVQVMNMEQMIQTEREVENDFLELCPTSLTHFSDMEQRHAFLQEIMQLRAEMTPLAWLKKVVDSQPQSQEPQSQEQKKSQPQPPPSLQEHERHAQEMRDAFAEGWPGE